MVRKQNQGRKAKKPSSFQKRKLKIYVEGGGNSKALRTECREGFSAFLESAGFQGKMPRIVACGSRRDAFEDFCTALTNGESALLLIDSEEAIKTIFQQGKAEDWQPWRHLAHREGDKWKKPRKARAYQCHLMVECMESWFLADICCLQSFFGQEFHSNSLPDTTKGIENIRKVEVYKGLNKATQKCKVPYNKGKNSFKILKRINPKKVIQQSPWAKRLIDYLSRVLS